MPDNEAAPRGFPGTTAESVSKALAVLGALGLLLYFFVGSSYRGYYARFGVTPEDVGVTRGTLIDQVGVAAAALAAIFGLFMAVGAGLRSFLERGSMPLASAPRPATRLGEFRSCSRSQCSGRRCSSTTTCSGDDL